MRRRRADGLDFLGRCGREGRSSAEDRASQWRQDHRGQDPRLRWRRCNVTHKVVTPFVEQTVKWFASLGVDLKREETGKLFPVTDKARTILTALLNRCRALSVIIHPDHRVMGLDRLPGPKAGFLVHHIHGTLHSRKVILATGGRSIPKSGSDGFGYSLTRRLGHYVTATVPALVPLILEDTMFHKSLSGLSQAVGLTTVVKSRLPNRKLALDAFRD